MKVAALKSTIHKQIENNSAPALRATTLSKTARAVLPGKSIQQNITLWQIRYSFVKNTLIDPIHQWFYLQIHKSHFEDMADTESTDETLEGISDEEDQDKEASSKYFVALWTPFCWKSKK